MSTANQAEVIRKVCESIVEGGKDLLSWEFEGYSSCMVAVFQSPDSSQVAGLLEKSLPFQFDSQSAATASPPVGALLGQLNGLRSGQRLFVSDPDVGEFVFGAWWPWGGGQKISIRIGIFVTEPDQATLDDVPEQLCAWFGVQG